MASSTTFSYAQAAKGHTISQPSPQLTSSSAPASVKDDLPTGNTSVSAPSVTSNDADARDSGKQAKPDVDSAVPRHDLDLTSLAGPAPSTVSVEHESKPRRERGPTASEPRSRTKERGSRSASRTSRANDNHDGKKGRKSRKPREKDTQSEKSQEDEKKEETPKPVLSEAPPPAVNVWAQRIEAKQATKTKPASALAVGPAASEQQESKKPQEAADIQAASTAGPIGDQAQKKPVDLTQTADPAPRRNAPRGSRATEKEEKTTASPPPPVADVFSWPDPKAAATSEEATRKPQEKLEGGEKEGQDDSGASKRKWKSLDIHPTVVFNTPIPPRGGKSRTAARGGRDGASTRPGHGNPANGNSSTSAGERPPVVNGSAGPKAATSHAREGHAASRTSTQPPPAVPHPTKRGSVDGHKDQRKASASTSAEQSRESGPEASSTSRRASAFRDIRTDVGSANFEPGQALPRTHTQERGNHGHQQNKEANHGSNSHGQQFAQGERRGDRARHGGSFRGRGGHNNGAGSQPFTNGQYATHAPYSGRQNATAPSPPLYGHFQPPFPPNHRGGRGGKWAPPRNSANGNGHAPKPSYGNDMPVQTLPSNYMYPLPQIDVVNIQAIIRAQVEYYFSVDNLCKDLHLRAQMDSQGFVPLTTILGFKRMQELVQDVNMVRLALSVSDTLEFGTGEDGIERLRIRGQWDKFVLAVTERDEAARNEGPAVFHPAPRNSLGSYGAPIMHPGYHNGHAGGMFSGLPEEQLAGYPNGASFEHPDNAIQYFGPNPQLSAGVPEHAPHFPTLESMTNFSDEQVNDMMVFLDAVKKDSNDSDGVVNGGQNGTAGTTSTNGHAADEAAETKGSSKTDARPYHEIKAKALEKRRNGQPGETPAIMQNLYHFWSEMLLKDFNSNVYMEFMECAHQDAQQQVPAMVGIQTLLGFYERLLHKTEGQKPWPKDRTIPEIFTLHYQESAELNRQARTRLESSA